MLMFLMIRRILVRVWNDRQLLLLAFSLLVFYLFIYHHFFFDHLPHNLIGYQGSPSVMTCSEGIVPLRGFVV